MVAAVAFVALALLQNWSETEKALKAADPWWIALALLFAFGSMIWMAWRWNAAMRAAGGEEASSSRVIGMFFLGELGKYVPGGIWSVLGRAELARRHGHSRTVAYSGVALSLVSCYSAAATVALILAIASSSTSSPQIPWWPIAIVFVGGLALLHPSVHSPVVTALRRVSSRPLDVQSPGWPTSLRLTASYVPAWIGIAAASCFVTRSFGPHEEIARIGMAAVTGWIVGFITPTPGGIGVREAVFIGLAGLPLGTGAAVTILCRLVFISVDAIGAAIGWTVLRYAKESPLPATSVGLEN